MSESVTNESTKPNVGSAGSLLRAAREASGLHVAALAVSMKVPVKKLEALEADRLDLLPDAVFVRALASSVCRALRIDPAPVLERLPHNTIPRLNAKGRSINTPFHSPGNHGYPSIRDFLGRPSAILVAVFMVSALVLAFFPEAQSPIETVEIAGPTLAESASSVASPLVIPSASAGATDPVAAAKSLPVPEEKLTKLEVPIGSIQTASSAPVPSAAMVASGAQIGSEPVGASSLSAGLIEFSVKGASWVEVTDAKGVVQLRRTMAAGELASTSMSGALPLSVVIGRADVTEVFVRGKSFNLAGISKDNVARFEVK